MGDAITASFEQEENQVQLYRLTDEGPIPFPIEKYLELGNHIDHRPGPTAPTTLQVARRAPVRRGWISRLLEALKNE